MSTANDSDAKEASVDKSETIDNRKEGSGEKKTDSGRKARAKAVKKKKSSTKKKTSKKKSVSRKVVKKKKAHSKKTKVIKKKMTEALTGAGPDTRTISKHRPGTQENAVAGSMRRDKKEPVTGRVDLPRSDNQLPGLFSGNFIYIFLVLAVAAIILFVTMGGPELTPGPSQPPGTISTAPLKEISESYQGTEIQAAGSTEQYPSALPKESTLLAENEIPKAIVAPIRISAAQLAGRIELDALRSLFAPGGWGVGRDASGNLILAPGVLTTPIDPSSYTTGFNRSQVAALASLLSSRGWVVRLDSAGDLILFPGAVVSSTIPGTGVVPSSEETGLKHLRALLELRGWKVGTDPTGATILIPH